VLELIGVQKSYGRMTALHNIDLDVRPGEIVALVGPSGAGKTTTLHVTAGILRPEKGRILLDGADISRVPLWKRDVALVQETYALYPHLTVLKNITSPLRSPLAGESTSPDEIARRARDVAEVLGIEHLLETRIQHLSGGQRQRVALGRALVREPRVFLLDEPIAHLDAKLRHWLRGELRQRLTSSGRPCLWATPDGKEALSVADRVAVIVDGHIAQFGEPRAVFRRPATARVAEIVSDPPISVLNGVVDPARARLYLRGSAASLPLSFDRAGDLPSGEILAGVRPSSLRLVSGVGRTRTPAQVMTREFTTRETIVSVRLGGSTLRVLSEPFSEFRTDQEVVIEWQGATVYVFEPGGDRRLVCHSVVNSEGNGGGIPA
jgi:multiple sugar transport system ATP-binding protein